MNSSFLLVLFLSWCHFLAVAYPHFYKQFVTKKRVTALVTGIFVYTTTFSFLQFSRIWKHVLLLLDVFLHATINPFLFMLSYVAMLVSLRKHRRNRNVLFFRRRNLITGKSESSINLHTSPSKTHSVERQFMKMNSCLIILFFICTLPSIIMMHVALNTATCNNTTAYRFSSCAISFPEAAILLVSEGCFEHMTKGTSGDDVGRCAKKLPMTFCLLSFP